MKAKSPRVLVFVGDIHAGSTLSLIPGGFETLEGNAVQPNLVQRWLMKCWKHATKEWLPSILGGDPHALVIMGDCVEGCHHGTKQIISPDVTDHIEAARQLLAPLAKDASRVFMLAGTEAHTGTSESKLGHILGAMQNPETGRHSFERLPLICGGVRCICTHHISTSARMYLRASALSIFLANEQLEAVNNGEEVPRVLVCGHRHTYDYYEHANALCLSTPPWQSLSRFGSKVVPSARTKPGIVVLDWRDRNDGELPEQKVITFRPPAGRGIDL